MVFDMTWKVVSRAPGVALAVMLLASDASAQVAVGSVSGSPGSTVTIPVNFTSTSGFVATGLSVTIGFETSAPLDAAGSPAKPACTVNPAIMKESTDFNFLPNGCAHGTDCEQALAGVVSFNPANNPLEIPTGEVFTCSFTIPAGAGENDTFAFDVDSAVANDVDGNESNITEGSAGGTVSVVLATVTPTATNTPDVPTVTNTPVGTATNTPRPPGTGGEDDDGCQMVAPADASSAWLLFIPAAVLIWRRRRAL